MEENKFYHCGETDEEFNKILDVLVKEFDFKHERVDIGFDKKVYYVINQNKLHNYCTFNVDFLDDNIKKLVKNKFNFNIIIQSAHESLDEVNLLKLKQYLIDNKLEQKKFYLLNNASNLDDLQNKNKTEFNCFKLNYLSYLKINDMKSSTKTEYKQDKSNGKFFTCFNKEDKRHRYGILIHLMKNDMLNDTNWSFLPTNKMNFTSIQLKPILYDELIEVYEKEIKYFVDLKYKFSDHEFNIEYNLNNVLMQTMVENTVNYENSYVNLTTESVFDERESIVHITEKSFKPFFYYQFPLILASENHIRKMKDLYNYDFFEDIINLEYDSITDDKERFLCYTKEINRLYNNKDYLISFYKNNRDRFENNKQKTLDIIKLIEKDYEYFKGLI